MKYNSISKIFIDEEGFFSANKFNNDISWIEHIYSNEQKDYIVLMQNVHTSERLIFQININRFSNSKKYLVIFTDITMIENQRREYLHKASHDTLTGALNRSSFNELLQAKIVEARSTQTPLALALIDIDHFKKVNDEHGHLVGDNVLKTLTKIVLAHIRSTDIFARWGGEEFALIIPNATKDNALHILEKLRYEVMNTKFDSVEKVTCSFGVTLYIYGDSINDMMQRADDSLYQAKENGRNKVIFL